MDAIDNAIDTGGGQVCDVPGVRRELDRGGFKIVGLRPIADAPMDGREVLVTDGVYWRVAIPKAFREGIWEYHRDDANCPGHSWSLAPTHFIELGDLPKVPK